MENMVQFLLEEGTKTGFSTVEAFGETLKEQEYECFPGEQPTLHKLDSNRVIVRAFWEIGDPVGFSLSCPDETSAKSAFNNIYSTILPDTKPNYRNTLPQTVKKESPLIFDETIGKIDVHAFNQLIDQINEIAITPEFRDMKLRRTHLSKSIRKVYISNTNGLNAKYLKSHFTLTLNAAFKNNRIVVRESRIFFNQLDPFKIISRAFNLLNSLSEDTPFTTEKKNIGLVLSPEAAVFLLREFSHYFKIRTDNEMMDIQYPSVLNIIDNPSIDAQSGSVPFDDEGVQSGEKFLIQKGVFSMVIQDLATAAKNGSTSTGNGFRGERSSFPTVRFSNLYIKPTILPVKNLMTDANEGILVSLLKLRNVEKDEYHFSAYGYRFKNEDILEPVHLIFKTSFRSYFLKILKISKEIKYFYSTYNIGSPYVLVEATRKNDGTFEI